MITSNNITGIKPGTDNITGQIGIGINGASPVELLAITYSNWYLGSKDEMSLVYTNLVSLGIGGFDPADYYTSSEVDNENVYIQSMQNGNSSSTFKTDTLRVRAIRTFISTYPFVVGDKTDSGGWIFNKSSITYMEVAPTDQSLSQTWSNIVDIAVTGTDTAIGTGQSNTTKIIAQTGHIDSAAKLCNDLIIIQ